MKNWILCFQTPYNNIKYITNNLDIPTTSEFYKFLDYIQTIFLYDYNNFIEELNKFKTILIDIDEHKWKLYIEEKKEYTFDELLKFNDKENLEIKIKQEKAREFVKKFNDKKIIKDIMDDKRNNY